MNCRKKCKGIRGRQPWLPQGIAEWFCASRLTMEAARKLWMRRTLYWRKSARRGPRGNWTHPDWKRNFIPRDYQDLVLRFGTSEESRLRTFCYGRLRMPRFL